MATAEQKAASKQVMDAVTALNKAMENADAKGLFVELGTSHGVGRHNPLYQVSKIETRETVLP
jgi:hypothetical protein